jgi:hypothetical protein
VIDAAGAGVVVHCCAPSPPVTLLREAGASALSIDATLKALPETLDELGEAWQAGTTVFLGLVPSTGPAEPVELRALAKPALDLADRLGFPRSILGELAVPTPTCGMAGASAKWVRRALSLTRDLGKAFLEPPEEW